MSNEPSIEDKKIRDQPTSPFKQSSREKTSKAVSSATKRGKGKALEDAPTETRQTPPQTKSKKKKQKDETKNLKLALERETRRQSHLLAETQKVTKGMQTLEITSSSSGTNSYKKARSLVVAQTLLDREKAKATPSSNRKSPKVEKNDSSLSLEYSTDGSSAFFHEGTSLLGNNLVPPAENSVTGTRAGDADEDENSYLSIQESSSSAVSVVPTDEELYAVGWAKALDPKSGNHYYFTLDRTKTVWDNPLARG